MEGQLLGGRYQLLRQLGEGGMGQVWEARDEVLGRLVAVKVIAMLAGGGSRGEEVRARFLREARITAGLQHPNIVTIHDLGETGVEGGRAPFLVMELLRGEGLDAVVGRGPAALPDAARWGAQICDALADAHGAHVLHRDVKPSNVLVTAAGAVKVLDFGIARAADPYATANRLTQTGFIVGTPPYMAPEQARGRPEARSDLYALGCLLFELITGRLPFRAPDTIGFLTAHLTETPPAPSTIAGHIPPGWDALVLTLLRKEPGERYASAAEVAQALRQLEEEKRERGPVHEPAREPEPAHVPGGGDREAFVNVARALRLLEHSRRGQEEQERGPGFERARVPSQTRVLTRPALTPPMEGPSGSVPQGRKVLGFLGRLVIAAVILGVMAFVAHVIDPEESWSIEGPDWFVIAVAVGICGWLTWKSDRE